MTEATQHARMYTFSIVTICIPTKISFYPLTDLLTIFINYGFMILKFYMVVQSLSSFQLFAAPQTIARQAPLSLGFPRQEYWRGLPFASPVDLPDPGIEPMSPALAGRFFTTEPPGKPF